MWRYNNMFYLFWKFLHIDPSVAINLLNWNNDNLLNVKLSETFACNWRESRPHSESVLTFKAVEETQGKQCCLIRGKGHSKYAHVPGLSILALQQIILTIPTWFIVPLVEITANLIAVSISLSKAAFTKYTGFKLKNRASWLAYQQCFLYFRGHWCSNIIGILW